MYYTVAPNFKIKPLNSKSFPINQFITQLTIRNRVPIGSEEIFAIKILMFLSIISKEIKNSVMMIPFFSFHFQA